MGGKQQRGPSKWGQVVEGDRCQGYRYGVEQMTGKPDRRGRTQGGKTAAVQGGWGQATRGISTMGAGEGCTGTGEGGREPGWQVVMGGQAARVRDQATGLPCHCLPAAVVGEGQI